MDYRKRVLHYQEKQKKEIWKALVKEIKFCLKELIKETKWKVGLTEFFTFKELKEKLNHKFKGLDFKFSRWGDNIYIKWEIIPDGKGKK